MLIVYIFFVAGLHIFAKIPLQPQVVLSNYLFILHHVPKLRIQNTVCVTRKWKDMDANKNCSTCALWSLFSFSRFACWATVLSCFLLCFSEHNWGTKYRHLQITNVCSLYCSICQNLILIFTNLLIGWQVFILIITWGSIFLILLRWGWLKKTKNP